MTGRTETRHVQGAGSQESLFAAGGGPAPTVPSLPLARPVPVITSGQIEYAARCPACRNWHRHVSLGEKTAPCGTTYLLEPKHGRLKGAA